MIARRSVLLLPLLAAACGGEDATPRSFAMPSYSYLTPIRLNVASVEIDNQVSAGGDPALTEIAPLRPAEGLKQMANDRLVAAGSAGRAVFVIDEATLRRVSGGIEGTLAVHLDVFAGQGEDRAGFAEARVARRRTSNDMGEDPRAVLYDFTTQMLSDMNVEFEFQVKRSLRDWLQAAAGTAPPPPPVEAEPLAAPSRAPTLRPRPLLAPSP